MKAWHPDGHYLLNGQWIPTVSPLRRTNALVWLALVALAPLGAAYAGERTVTVSATGEVHAKPTTVEIALLASGSAELSSDALVKYRASVRRTLDAFTRLKLERLTIAQEEITIGGPQNDGNVGYAIAIPGNGDGTEKVRSEVRIARTLRLKLSGAQDLTEEQLIDTIVRLMDVAKDSGNLIVGTGTPAMVAFSVDKADVLRDKAAQAAMAQARARAAKYAELAGASLGDVLSVEEVGSGMEYVNTVWSSPYGYQRDGNLSLGTAGENKLVSPSLGEIPMRITLQVRFAMLPINGADKK